MKLRALQLICSAIISSIVMSTAQAKAVSLGVFDGSLYSYEDSTVIVSKDIVIAWVATTEHKFNYTNDEDYAGAFGRFAINCREATSVFIEGATINTHGDIIRSGKIPQDNWQVIPIQYHTPQSALFEALCVNHPDI